MKADVAFKSIKIKFVIAYTCTCTHLVLSTKKTNAWTSYKTMQTT